MMYICENDHRWDDETHNECPWCLEEFLSRKEPIMAMIKDKWNDISSEVYREYLYADGSILHVDSPTLLNVSESSLGGHAHRVQTASGYGYYVAPGWQAIRWQAKEGQPLFTF